MLPPRKPMSLIDINRAHRGHLTPRSRVRIVEHYNCGFILAAIILGFDLLDSTVRYTLENDDLRYKGESQPRIPRNKLYTYIEERNILRFIRLNPKATYV
jgi:hypothetical protein